MRYIDEEIKLYDELNKLQTGDLSQKDLARTEEILKLLHDIETKEAAEIDAEHEERMQQIDRLMKKLGL